MSRALQTEAASTLIALLTLMLLPACRVWKSIGYDRSPGVLVSTVSVLFVGEYIGFTYGFLIRRLDAHSKWIGWCVSGVSMARPAPEARGL